MNLYLISQKERGGWDTYDSAVVVAENEQDARLVHPSNQEDYIDDNYKEKGPWYKGKKIQRSYATWVLPEYVEVKLIGSAHESLKAGEVICASFNAG